MPPQNGIPADLKSLLSKWKLECILSHLLVEKIDTDVLEMMKLSHIRQLLQNFPLGIQIRFEYYLEQWRDEIGKPFQTFPNDDRSLFITKEQDLKTKTIGKQMESKSTQTDLIIYKINTMPQTNKESTKDIPRSFISLAKEPIGVKLLPEQPPPSDPPPSPPKSSPPIKKQVDLLTILKNASCGIGLITSYGLHQSFTNSERKLLIDTIVDHYIKNNLDFNIQISHLLEQEILKMFPSEKLSSYRIAKCGKIFIAYIKAKAKAKAKIATPGREVYKIGNNMVVDEDFEELYHLPDDHIVIQTSNATGSLDGLNDDTVMSDNTESMIFTIDHSDDEGSEDTDTKIDSGEIDVAATLDSATLIRKMLSQKRLRIEQIDRPFIDFSIPWDKVPDDVICSLENGQALGKRLNTFANLVVDELRKISTHVPMRVLRAVSQQAVMKYPHSFLDKDSEGNLKPSTTTALLSRLRNRNTFLNRQDR